MEHDPAIQLLRGAALHRDYAVDCLELRAVNDGDPESSLVNFTGYASVTDRAYPMYGGAEAGFPGFDESISRGAFKKTLSEKPDVAFLVNHGGLTLARTKAGTLKLAEDKVGLAVEAELDRRVSIVNDIAVLMETKALDEMSFAFRVVKDQWTTADGEEVPWWDEAAVNRSITEVSMHKGDVSVVNYGANPYTSGSIRSLDAALAELIAFRGPSVIGSEELARSREYLDKLAGIGRNTEITINMPPGSDGDHVVQALKRYKRRDGAIPLEEFLFLRELPNLRAKYAA